MCAVCRHPDRNAIEAALQAGRPLRSLAVDYPGLNKSSLGRHRKDCMAAAPAGPLGAPGCTAPQEPAPEVILEVAPHNRPAVRQRTRPKTDEEARLRTVMLLRAEGRTYVEIARRLGVHSSTVRELIARANAGALERVRAQTVEVLVAQYMVERQDRARNLARLQEQAEARNDIRTQIDIERLKLAEAREHREWLGSVGAFDHFRIPTEDEQQHSRRNGSDLIDMFRDVVERALWSDETDDELSLGPAGTTH